MNNNCSKMAIRFKGIITNGKIICIDDKKTRKYGLKKDEVPCTIVVPIKYITYMG